jgi:hypothetical protein
VLAVGSGVAGAGAVLVTDGAPPRKAAVRQTSEVLAGGAGGVSAASPQATSSTKATTALSAE